jgi:DNA recombination-dependent growth factor C
MGAYQGSVSYRQYRLADHLPNNWQTRLLEGCIAHLAKEIDPNSEDTRHIGWCDAKSPMSTQLTLDRIVSNDYVVLAMRVDTLNVPKGLLRFHCDQEELKVLKETKKEALTRYEKGEIRDVVEKRLRNRLFPSVKWVDMVWNIQTGVVRFFTTSKGLNEEFVELFEEGFGISLIPDFPYTMAQLPEMGLSDEALDALESIEQSSFVDLDTLFETERS